MGIDKIALTAADYAAGLRALADALEERGLPRDVRHADQPLTTTLVVGSLDAVRDFAATYDLTVDVNANHTSAKLATGPNPNTYYDASIELTVLYIDKSAEPEEAPVEEPAPAAVPAADPIPDSRIEDEPVYLENDGVVMKTTADNDDLQDLQDDGWQRITEAEAMSWQPIDVEPDGAEPVLDTCGHCDAELPAHTTDHRCSTSFDPVGALTAPPGVVLVPPPGLPPEARTALADAVSAARLVMDPSSTPALVQLDWEEDVQAKLVAVGEAARAWHAADPDQPEGIEAEAVLSDAVSAYVAVMGR